MNKSKQVVFSVVLAVVVCLANGGPVRAAGTATPTHYAWAYADPVAPALGVEAVLTMPARARDMDAGQVFVAGQIGLCSVPVTPCGGALGGGFIETGVMSGTLTGYTYPVQYVAWTPAAFPSETFYWFDDEALAFGSHRYRMRVLYDAAQVAWVVARMDCGALDWSRCQQVAFGAEHVQYRLPTQSTTGSPALVTGARVYAGTTAAASKSGVAPRTRGDWVGVRTTADGATWAQAAFATARRVTSDSTFRVLIETWSGHAAACGPYDGVVCTYP